MNTLRIRSHDDLISSVPHLVRFHPEGMVCVPLSGDGPIARLDLPPTPKEMEPFLQTLSDTYLRRHPTQRIALLAYGEDAKACIEALTELGDRLTNGQRHPDVGPILWVNGDQWFDVLAGTSGTVDPSARARMDAEFALMGKVRPSGSRTDLAAALQGDPAPVAAHLEAAQERLMTMDLSGFNSEVEWLGSRLDEFTENRQPLSDVDAARALAAIQAGTARDAALIRITPASAPVHTDLWRDLVRRSPDEVRDQAACILALSSYMDGNAGQAWVALDQITEAPPALAEVVQTALEHAVRPEVLERMLHEPSGGNAAMQQAALRNQPAQGPRGHENDNPNNRGIDGPDSASPSR